MSIQYELDTISAIATPLGTGGVAVIRISGTKSFDVVKKIFSNKTIAPGKILHGWITDKEEVIDEVIVLPFKTPNSFTGEDVIEIQCHGGVNITKKIFDLTLKYGARLAQKGEFTKRAFLNKKMDLSQAEAVLDIINAKTVNFAIKSAKNLSGKLSQKINDIRDNVFQLLSIIVAAIDFPEDVVEPEYSLLIEKIVKILAEIKQVLDFSKTSNIQRQGIKIAIVGRPNVGKSSLFNALLNLERAIVTDIAGTTRDVIQESFDVNGICTTLIDTAGIRECKNLDKVEEIGIEYTKKSIEDADVVLFLYDSTVGLTKEDKEIFDLINDKSYIKIATKADLLKKLEPDVLTISTTTGQNLDKLKEEIEKLTIQTNTTETEFITNQRQQESLQKAQEALTRALNACEQQELQDLISIDVKEALMHISEINGEVITDDILNNIFDNFCIGK